MSDDPTPTPEPSHAPPPAEAPDWAKDLQRTITELPGKLKAVVSDDDKSGIAEAVHGLFERSGAFESGGGEATKDETETTEATKPETKVTPAADETTPKRGGGLSGFAAKFLGE